MSSLNLLLRLNAATCLAFGVLFATRPADAGWVVAILFLVATGIFITNSPGIVATLIVAVVVGALGGLQFKRIPG